MKNPEYELYLKEDKNPTTVHHGRSVWDNHTS